eukprot:Em0024g140a
MATFDRAAAEEECRVVQAQSDDKMTQMAEEMRREKDGLEAEIKNTVDPIVVLVSTSDWEGTAFICHQDWLVATSHLLPDKEALESCEMMSNTGDISGINSQNAYFRPHSKHVPDVTLVKLGKSIEKSLLFQFTDDVGLGETVYFYSFRDTYTKELKTAYIELVSKKDQKPLIFKCKEGEPPTPGISGAPVFEARVLIARKPKWQLKLVGMVYACSSDEQHLCVISVHDEFNQIRQEVLIPLQTRTRSIQLAEASEILNDGVSASEHADSAQHQGQLMEQGISNYANGVSDIAMIPIADVVCLKKGIVSLDRSWLLKKNQKRQKIKLRKAVVNLDELQKFYDELISKIELEKEQITLAQRDGFYSNYYFRLDVRGGSKANWKMDIQDNTGDVAFSQVFAIATVSQTRRVVKGNTLAELLRASAKSGTAQHLK